METDQANKTDGRIAYEAYLASCGGKSIRGEDLPTWADQELRIRTHWEAAGRAVRERVAP